MTAAAEVLYGGARAGMTSRRIVKTHHFPRHAHPLCALLQISGDSELVGHIEDQITDGTPPRWCGVAKREEIRLPARGSALQNY